jgi:UDP-N-acetylmuramoyl-L-alanyl-D-glutamate--2,6-diaminopimelate ligase
MRLEQLAAALGSGGTLSGGSPDITELAYDSRLAGPGCLFFCVRGFRSDGHEFAARAVSAGAAALVVERPLGLGVPELRVASVRSAMAPLAACFHDHPARELALLGVTGTNGKTTTAYLLRALMEASGRPCGMLGTVKSVIGGEERPVERTTPEAIDLQADLRAMADRGDRACAMEVSSHALALDRVSATEFAAAVFTNLTQDHLDFHPTMEDYFLAKRRLFLPQDATPPPGVSVINVGDAHGARLAQELPEARTYALEARADFAAWDISCSFDGARFTLDAGGERRAVALPMPGRFNVANGLAALATAHALGCELDVLIDTLERGVRVPGRFEPVEEGQDFAVIVDYAHTPDSLENVLLAARELAAGHSRDGRVLCVFGAGGDRDRGKRPQMGEIAAALADLVLVTSDNPRSEDPLAIVGEILDGVPDGARAEVHSQVDRRVAIGEAVAAATSGDVLVIAGKGHEQGQEFADGRKLPFDDVTVAREALLARHAGAERVP